MTVLVTGASGFLGRSLVAALRARGARVIEAVRHPARATQAIAVDFRRDTEASVWEARLAGVDVVVNMVGLFAEGRSGTFEDVHVRAPTALFRACARAGVRRVVQLSALGADEGAASAFHLSKKRADDALLALPLDATVVQPSLVFGLDGASTRWLLALAALPLQALPGGGRQRVQPVHVEDLVDGLVALVCMRDAPPRIAMVGPAPLALRDYLAALRGSFGAARARVIAIPRRGAAAMTALARAFGAPVTRDALDMLERGNVADAAPFARLLGRAPRAPQAFVPAHAADAARRLAWLTLSLPPLRTSVSLLWLWSAFASALLYPLERSLALLGALGLAGAPAKLALGAGVAVDLLLGLAMWRRSWRPTVYTLQIATTVGYTMLISFALPEFWSHPFAPLAKNVPLLAATALLKVLDR